MIKIKRIYEPASKDDGFRILVDRLWPRGLKKEDANINLWLKAVAPSVALRKWFDHKPEKWQAFKKSYFEELAVNIAVKEILDAYKKHHIITLLYAARDQVHNHAGALYSFLEKEID